MTKFSKFNQGRFSSKKKSKFKIIASKTDLISSDAVMIKDDSLIFDEYLSVLFPYEQEIKRIIQKNKAPKIYKHDDPYMAEVLHYIRREDPYTVDFLPFHLRDQEWLIEYVTQTLRNKTPFKDVKHDVVENYIHKSANFKKACERFGRKFLKVKIENMMISPRAVHESIVETGFPDFDHLLDCDDQFRMYALAYFLVKGYDRHTVEVGLEVNANLWRKKTMTKAFMNYYYPLQKMVKISKDNSLWWHKLTKLKHQHLTYWLKYREHQYYQKHKAIINELGLQTENMSMKPEKLQKLMQKLQYFEKQRNAMLKNKLIERHYFASLAKNNDDRQSLK